MARLQFEFFMDEWSTKNRGINSKFTDGNGVVTTSWWSSPPSKIDHVDIGYIKGRYGNVKTKHHEEFIKKQFKEQIALFKKCEGSKFKKTSDSYELSIIFESKELTKTQKSELLEKIDALFEASHLVKIRLEPIV